MTLIELMVVIVVISVLAGAILPSLVSAARRSGIDTAAVKTVGLLNFAYAAAVGRRQSVTVNLDVERGECWVTAQPTSLPWLAEELEPTVQTLAAVKLPEGLTIRVQREATTGAFVSGESWETVCFRPDGTAEEVSIELEDSRGARKLIEVSSVTGEAYLLDEE